MVGRGLLQKHFCQACINLPAMILVKIDMKRRKLHGNLCKNNDNFKYSNYKQMGTAGNESGQQS